MKTHLTFQQFLFQFSDSLKKLLAIILLALSHTVATAQTSVGPYEYQSRDANPFREPFVFLYRHTPVALDFDRDGDADIAVADFDGGNGFHYLRNTGTAASPAFVKIRGIGNPFYFTAYDDGATPAFTDLDKDGDLDMLLGIIDGTFRYYRNSGSGAVPFVLQTGAWNPTTKSGNPLNGVDLGDYASPFFVDFDNDGDDDLIIGSSYGTPSKSIHYYTNDGQGNFTINSLTGINPVADAVTPVLIDVDRDGGLDVLTGEASGIIRYFRRTGATSFTEQAGASNPFNGIDKGEHSSPTVADFNADGDLDVVIGAELSQVDLSWFENTGANQFTEKLKFDNPFDGLDVGTSASPLFVDVDSDGDADLLIGNRSTGATRMSYFRNDNGAFVDATAGSSFASLVMPHSLTPSYVDLDGDGDKDLVGGVNNNTTGTSVIYFRNDNGTFVEQNFASGPFKDITIEEGKTDFADIDADGDYDMFISDVTGDFYTQTFFLRFFKNTGTATNPIFTEFTSTDNPLSTVSEQHQIYPRFSDIDNDGDLDAIIGEAGGVVENEDGNEFSFYENTGTSANPVFTYREDLLQQGTNPFNPSPAFIDYDFDGDKDIFVGDVSGYISFVKNTNLPAAATLNSAPLNVSVSETFVDNELTIADPDNDFIVAASVKISPYDGNETLTWSAIPGIQSLFSEGTLQFAGAATVATYQTMLRSLKIQYSSESTSGRQRNAVHSTVSKIISVRVWDADKTVSPSNFRVINFISNEAPVFSDFTTSTNANSSTTLDLKTLATDSNNNLDLSSFSIVTQPSSGAIATVDNNGVLHVNYSTVAFAGIESVTVAVSDIDGATDQSVITIAVINNAPVIDPIHIALTQASSHSLNILERISDSEENLQLSSIEIVSGLVSGANATLNAASETEVILTIDYSSTETFFGNEQLTIRACDKVGACAQNIVTVNVEQTPAIKIYNAVAPNSSGDNKYFRIMNISDSNHVTIFNRWGDIVFETQGYDNNIAGKRFEGINQNGNALPSGTYFYKIEYLDSTTAKTLTGYLSLKQ